MKAMQLTISQVILREPRAFSHNQSFIFGSAYRSQSAELTGNGSVQNLLALADEYL